MRNNWRRLRVIAVVRFVIAGVALLFVKRVARGQTASFSLPDAPVATWGGTAPLPSQFQDLDTSWRKLPKRVLHDQKDIWLFPTQLARGHYWAPTLGLVAGTTGLIVADPHVMPYFRNHAGNLDDVNDTFDGTITAAEIAIVPVSILASGYIRHDPYDVKTGLLAGEAFVDGEILDLAMKAVTRRDRPSDVQPGAPFNDTFFKSGKSPLSDSSFPSGHAVGAFSVATVIAHRYRQHRWVPWAAYGLASAIKLFPSDNGRAFPFRCVPGCRVGIHDHSL